MAFPNLSWKIEPIELNQVVIKYTRTGVNWYTVTKTGEVNTEIETFPTVKEAEQALDLLIHDFGGERIDNG